MDLQLYNYFRSSTSYRVRIAMHLKELNFDYKPVHLIKEGGEQHREGYLALNPSGEVPTLIHNGNSIGQSMAIIEYLEEQFPDKPLYPKDVAVKAKVRQFAETINCVHSLQNLKVLKYLETELKLDDNQKSEWVNEWMHRVFKALEKMTSNNPGEFCFGDRPTVAEAFLIPQCFSASRFNVDFSSYKNLFRINETCLKLEAFKKAHPNFQVDAPV